MYGKNLWGIRRLSEENVTSRDIMKILKYAPCPDHDKWRVQVVKDLLEVKWNTSEIENIEISNDENDDILKTLCST